MTRLWIGLLCLLLAGCAAPKSAFDDLDIRSPNQTVDPLEKNALDKMPAAELVQKGQDYVGKGAYRVANVYFSRALAKDPTLLPAYLGQGQLAMMDGQMELARKIYDLALEQDPTHGPALLNAGRSARGYDNEAALDYFHRALAQVPDDPVILTELGMTYDAMGQPGKGEIFFRSVINKKPTGTAYNNLGFNLLLQGQTTEAISWLQRALLKDNDNVRGLNNLAVAYFLEGNKKKALRLFKDAVGMAGAYNNLGYFYMLAARYDEAEEALTQAMELHPRYYLRAQKNLEQLQLLRDETLEGRRPIRIKLTGAEGTALPLPSMEGWTTIEVPRTEDTPPKKH